MSVTDIINCMNFGRRLCGLRRSFAGGTLAIEAELCVFVCVSHGLERRVLERIRAEVHGIPAQSEP